MQKTGPFVQNFPGCCTSAVLYGFGEHDEPSEVTKERIIEMCKEIESPEYRIVDGRREVVDLGRLCIFATSVNPKNVEVLQEAGFKIVDEYKGIQGQVKVLTKHS